MGKMHERHVLTVYGRKPGLMDEPEYYMDISRIAEEVVEESEEPLFFTPMLNRPGDRIAEMVTPTRETAEEIQKRLKDLGRYERVEIESQEIDTSAFMPPGYKQP